MGEDEKEREKKIVYLGNEIRDKIFKATDKLAAAVKVTLGPKGRNVIIRKELEYYLTKDGVSVAKSIYTHDPIEQIVLDLMKDVALETNKAAGDGTTTAIVLAEYILKQGILKIIEGADPLELKREIEETTNVILSLLTQKAESITNKEDLVNIATISANNNKELGKLVADAIYDADENSLVDIKESPSSKSYVEAVKGYTLEYTGYLRKGFTNKGQKIEYQKPHFLFIDDKLNSIDSFRHVLENAAAEKRKLIVMARDFTDNVLNILLYNNQQGIVDVVPLKVPGIRHEKTNTLNDLAAFTKGEVFSSTNQHPVLGQADTIIIDKYNTTIVNEEADVSKTISDIEEEYKNSEAVFSEDKLKKRLANLAGKSSVIYVGGESELEVKETIDRVEDAINAAKAAKAEGIIAGGGITLYNIAQILEDECPCNSKIMIEAIRHPLYTIIDNATTDSTRQSDILSRINPKKYIGYNAKTDKIENMIDAKILDPVKVTREAVKNASAIASMLLTTEALVLNEF